MAVAPIAALHLLVGQSVHAETPVVIALYFPAEQAVQVPKVAEANWYFPTGQMVAQAVAALAALVTAAAVVLPLAQTVHELWPVAEVSVHLPIGQSVHTLLELTSALE